MVCGLQLEAIDATELNVADSPGRDLHLDPIGGVGDHARVRGEILRRDEDEPLSRLDIDMKIRLGGFCGKNIDERRQSEEPLRFRLAGQSDDATAPEAPPG